MADKENSKVKKPAGKTSNIQSGELHSKVEHETKILVSDKPIKNSSKVKKSIAKEAKFDTEINKSAKKINKSKALNKTGSNIIDLKPKKTTFKNDSSLRSVDDNPKSSFIQRNKIKLNPNDADTVSVKLIKSGAGRFKNQRQTLIALGLNKINKVSTLKDTPSVQGMIKTVAHLIEVIKN